MRSETEMFQLILDVAQNDERIRVVILNGSRANPRAQEDIFQDYDIVYFVNELETFLQNHDWIDVFGQRLILQMPDQFNSNISFAYLMIFADGNRIDLTLFPVNKIRGEFVFDSLSVLFLDKDNLFPDFPPADDSDYLIKKPAEKEFLDVCNEFWWVSTYVAKGLWRGEITYAKEMLENIVRKMFMKIIEWQIGTQTNFLVNFGKSGKNLKKLVEPDFYARILATYPDSNIENIWASLFLMADIFDKAAKKIAQQLQFSYDKAESENVLNYLKQVKSLPSKNAD